MASVDGSAASAAVCVAAGIFASAAEIVGKVVSVAGTDTPCCSTQLTAAVRAADVAGDPPGVVFAAFAPALHPRVVVCVLLVKDGAGGATAAPVAREVIEAALQAEH